MPISKSGLSSAVWARAPGARRSAARTAAETRRITISIALGPDLSLWRQADMGFAAVLDGHAMPEIVTALLELLHMKKARALHRLGRRGCRRAVDLVAGGAFGGGARGIYGPES